MPAYARGSKAWGMCMRCGLRFFYQDLVFDGYYPNLRVCRDCYDPPQPQERLAIVTDPEALWMPAPDSYTVYPPVLSYVLVGGSITLNWTSIGAANDQDTFEDEDEGPSHQLAGQSAGYIVFRSPDGVNYTPIATLLNTADEFGALSIETLTYTDNPGPGTWFYYVQGYDVYQNAEYG